MEFHQQKEENKQNPQIPQQTTHRFSQNREPNIFFNSNFDSGNMHRVVKTAYDHYSIWTASDAQGTENEGYPKSWFYFEVGGFFNRKVAFSVHRVHFLYAMAKRHHLYRPVYRINYETNEKSEWDRLPYPVISLSLNNEEQLVLKFDFIFNKLIKSVEFAFIYPYSYEESRSDTFSWREKYLQDKGIFFQNYELVKSYEGRPIDMIIISSHEGKEGAQTLKNADKFLNLNEQKIVKFRSNKPIIFISARVHPIETPSSFCMKGIIQFLLDKKDLRAYLLRKYFVFVLVPMLNPDGVFRGHCRMDALNQNLNRYYTNPDPQKQPSCYAVKKLCEHYSKDKRLFMYLDLHAHPAYKGNFTFGNAIFEFIEQVQSQLFPKVLSQNCKSFEFQQCIFSRKHMKAKDRNQDVSKEGCGRVVFYKQFGLVHSYTLECGYHLNTFDNMLEPEKESDRKFIVKYKINDKGQKIYEQHEKLIDQQKLGKMQEDQNQNYQVFQCTPHELDDPQHPYYKREIQTYIQDTFYNLGRNILISILDIWNKNPFSRCADLNACRRQIAEKQSKLDRFRKQQSGIKAKQKKIVELIEQQFYGQWHRRNVFNAFVTSQNNQNREKKRNHTVQFQMSKAPNKSQKTEKTEKIIKAEQRTISNSDTGADVQFQEKSTKNIKSTDQKPQLISQTQNTISITENRVYISKNYKLNRGLQNSTNNNRQKDNRMMPSSVGTNKQLIGTQIKISIEEEISRINRNDALSLSSKIIKNPNFNLGNLRVRNLMIASNMNSQSIPNQKK